MGKGKGRISETVFPIKPGQVIFELSNVSSSKQVVEAFTLISKKFSIKTMFKSTDFFVFPAFRRKKMLKK